jgi:hypothetical protein
MPNLATPVLFTSLLVLGAAAAQQTPIGPQGFAMDRVHGIVHDDAGAPWAIGRDYKARLADGRIEFTPALGSGVPHNLPLTFQLQTIGRGATVVHEAQAAPATTVDGQAVTFARGIVHERYECRPEGVEQSFVFAARPAGNGDLVVRGAITTELQPATRADGTLFFNDGRIGGVTLGGVTGIDAHGTSVAGTMRFAGGVLELRLPAAFVDRATFPLVLDPLLGTGFIAGDTFEDEDQVDTAFEEGLNVWLVVWRRTFSQLDQDIQAQRVTATGAFFGTIVAITLSATTVEVRPSVAAINSRNRFVVAWQWSPTGYGPFRIRAVSVSTATIGATVDVSPFGESSFGPSICGDRGISGTKALIAWATDNGPAKWRNANVSATGVITLETVHASIDPMLSVRLPKSRASAGSTVLIRTGFVLIGTLVAEVLDYDGVSLASTLVTGTSGSASVHGTHGVDGNGTAFLVASTSVLTGGLPGPGICTALTWNGSTLTIGPSFQFTAAVPNSMAVSWLGERFLLAWEEPGPNPFDSELKAIAVKPDCTTCSVEFSVPVVTRPNQRAPAIGSCFAGGSALPRALLVWSETNITAPFRSLVHAQRFEAMLGVSPALLSAPCAGGGFAGTAQPFALGSEDFTFELAGGDPTAPLAVLGLGDGTAAPIPCGCSLINPLVAYASLAINGTARHAFPLPCNPLLLGVTLEFQWLTLGGSASPCPLVPGLSGSDRYLLTLSL